MPYTIQRWIEVGMAADEWPSYSPNCGPGPGSLLTTDVTTTRSSQTIGELQPWPGTSSFQTTFSVRLQDSGKVGLSSATPARSPRNRGQLSSAAAAGMPVEPAASSSTAATAIID